MPPPHAFYFKIPPNEKMLGYWRTVADRLYKLRYCQNIMGVTRLLALFDAPIDPALLIKAQAAGVNVGGMFNVMTGPPPVYRFTALYPQALDFVNAVRAYGSALLTAIEKSDAAVQLWYQHLWIELVSLLKCISSFLKPLLIHVSHAQIVPAKIKRPVGQPQHPQHDALIRGKRNDGAGLTCGCVQPAQRNGARLDRQHSFR